MHVTDATHSHSDYKQLLSGWQRMSLMPGTAILAANTQELFCYISNCLLVGKAAAGNRVGANHLHLGWSASSSCDFLDQGLMCLAKLVELRSAPLEGSGVATDKQHTVASYQWQGTEAWSHGHGVSCTRVGVAA